MRLLPLTTAGLALLLVGCASTPKQTGFLTTYANLKAEGDALHFRDGAKLKNYTKFMIEPIVAHSHAGESAGDEVAVRRVTRHFREQLQTKLSANYQIVDAAGPGVAKLRIAITDIDNSKPVLNIIPQTKLLGVGLGGCSMEGEVLDSETNEQLAAVVQSGKGSRMSFAGMSKHGDAKAVVESWVEAFVKRLDEVHGR